MITLLLNLTLKVIPLTFNISDIKKRWGKQYAPSDKVFFTDYSFRLSLVYPVYDDNQMPTLRRRWINDLSDMGIDVLMRRGPTRGTIHGFSARDSEIGLLNVYMKTADDVYRFLENYQYFVKEIVGPASDAAKDTIANIALDRHKLTRHKLFYNQYKYSIDIHVTRDLLHDKDTVWEMIKSVFDSDEDFKLSVPLRRIMEHDGSDPLAHSHYLVRRAISQLTRHKNSNMYVEYIPMKIYLMNENDIINLQMMVDARFTNATEIVLI